MKKLRVSLYRPISRRCVAPLSTLPRHPCPAPPARTRSPDSVESSEYLTSVAPESSTCASTRTGSGATCQNFSVSQHQLHCTQGLAACAPPRVNPDRYPTTKRGPSQDVPHRRPRVDKAGRQDRAEAGLHERPSDRSDQSTPRSGLTGRGCNRTRGEG